MNKETLKVILVKVKAWFLALAANLWEDYLKDILRSQIEELASQGITYISAYHESEAYEKKKEEIFNFVFKNIKLPIILRPFKGIIKAILSNYVEKQIEKGINALNSIKK